MGSAAPTMSTPPLFEGRPQPFTFGRWRVVCTDRSHGDFSPSSAGVAERRFLVVGDRPSVWLRQVHGIDVVWVDQCFPDSFPNGVEADAAITQRPDVALSVITADCAPIALISETYGAVVHAGWKGLLGGIVERTVAEIRAVAGADEPITAILGPCIHASSYSFGAELDAMVSHYGDTVRGHTTDGAIALDMPATVAAACDRADVVLVASLCHDTAHPNFFSHRTRRDLERQAMILWRAG